jgi:hypothetical protein
MDLVLDDEIAQAIENYEKSAIFSLVSMKRTNVKSSKSSEWKNFVKSVHDEMTDNGRLKIPYKKAMEEASRRKRISTNSKNVDESRRKKIQQNRNKKETGTQTQVGFKSSFEEIYSYKIKKNEDVLTTSDFYFEDITKCISTGLVKILDLYMREVPYEFFEIPAFRSYYDRCIEDTKIFINSLIYTHFNKKIFDEPYRPEINTVDIKFMDKYSISSLEIFWYITNSIFKNSRKFFSLDICTHMLVRKFD